MRKSDLIAHIKIKRNRRGMTIDEVTASVKRYGRKTVAQLGKILAEEVMIEQRARGVCDGCYQHPCVCS